MLNRIPEVRKYHEPKQFRVDGVNILACAGQDGEMGRYKIPLEIGEPE